MEYNFEEIGKRIAKERKAAGFKSQDSFLEYLSDEHGYHMGRNTLSDIETGKKGNYDFDFLCTLCKIFKCEIGFLLGEYECKTGRNTDIKEVTGLSEDSINKLTMLSSSQKQIVSQIINHSDFLKVIMKMQSLSQKESINAETGELIRSHMIRAINGEKAAPLTGNLIENAYLYSISTLLTGIVCDITNTDL